jgi:ribosomal peptide maturation radical SAM protein 1
MAFRSKSPGRVLAELDDLAGRWPIENVEAVDNILDAAYFKELIPSLAARRGPLRIFYEVKANLSREQVALLSRAGIYRIQPGIESMSDHVLQLMRKGTTALRNVQLLKWCREFGIGADWNILYGFPGETADDYANMIELLRSIDFLPPPSAVGPIRLDRFSPYFNTPASFGLTNVRPLPTYQFLYPGAGHSLADIANYFEFDYDEDVDPTGRAAAVIAFATDWMRSPQRGDVVLSETTDGAILIHDSRPGSLIPSLLLRDLEKEAYLFCDEMHTASAVASYLRDRFADIEEASVAECLDSLVANRLMITDGLHYLSVAVHQPARYETADRRIEAFAEAGGGADVR